MFSFAFILEEWSLFSYCAIFTVASSEPSHGKKEYRDSIKRVHLIKFYVNFYTNHKCCWISGNFRMYIVAACIQNLMNTALLCPKLTDGKFYFPFVLQTERTGTQSTGTSTGPTFTSGMAQAGVAGNPPEGSEPLFQVIDMGPDSVTEISAHVITTEREMPTGSSPGKKSTTDKKQNCTLPAWHRN